jgi:hypothetical protein
VVITPIIQRMSVISNHSYHHAKGEKFLSPFDIKWFVDEVQEEQLLFCSKICRCPTLATNPDGLQVVYEGYKTNDKRINTSANEKTKRKNE